MSRIAVVTGSTSGIGLAVAEALAASGHGVVLNSFSDEESDHAEAGRIAARHGVEAIYVQADMADGAACRRLIETTLARFGRIDVLVNNAGVQHVAPVEDFPVDQWNRILAINLSSAFHTIAAALPAMRAQGRGRIVNIASAHGLRASPYKAAYVSAKHGVLGLTKTVALETAESGITCNAICPGYVLTPLVEAQIPDQMKVHGMDRETVVRQVMLAKQPTRQFATVEEIGALVAFLAGDAARQITGAALPVDGGWTAQ